ncbi:hypothetical protein GJ744_005958 [Endocarpon pusillum]|uniref:AAA+ ATPase domain-containing protein n=1 Tax=Endocarpon pusillum TaxID=364733 RepID=A0A8H7AKQ6_9EURO|nr:hypothetical protein GJ744_005958 [Endocarpon pusillum]
MDLAGDDGKVNPDATTLKKFADAKRRLYDKMIREYIENGPQETNGDTGAKDEEIGESCQEKAIEEGMKCEPKNQYEGDPKCSCCINWVDKEPYKMRVKKTDDSVYALIVRIQMNHDELASKRTKIHSIVVQSPIIKEKLKVAFRDFPNLSLDTAKTTFTSPFEPFVYRWKALNEELRTETDDESRQHMRLLIDIIEPELREVLTSVEDFHLHNAISFAHLWAIFRPGILVCSILDKRECVFVLKQIPAYRSLPFGGDKFLSLVCQYIDWNGQRFVMKSHQLAITTYAGTIGVLDLGVGPFACLPDSASLRERLQKRGYLFQALASGISFFGYNAVGYVSDRDEMKAKKVHVNSRVVVDHSAYFRFNPDTDLVLDPLKTAKADSETIIHALGLNEQDDGVGKVEIVGTRAVKLTSDQLMTCRHLVRGFAFKTKKWFDFDIESLEEIDWNMAAFDRLVLPANLKSVFLAIARSQSKSTDNFDDIIEGKGRGVVMLLHGPPGVGKTLTAEAVAEAMQVPLFAMSAGDLGLDPHRVQERLSEAFEMAKRWKAVLLLDEADVFMEQRTMGDLVRSELVSIFLQNLEYYEGTLFLTTNRVTCLDEAFESRIHLSVRYSSLDRASRHQVWKNFLASIPPEEHRVSDEDLDEFANWDLNGRVVKNLMKTAALLAADAKRPLTAEDVRTVFQLRSMNTTLMQTSVDQQKGVNIRHQE